MLNYKSKSVRQSLLLAFLLSGCSAPSAINEAKKALEVPTHWTNKQSNVAIKVTNDWVKSFNDASLQKLIAQALANNRDHKINQLTLALAIEQAGIADASLLPELSLSLDQSRRKSVGSDNVAYSNSADISLQLTYELDVWGKLSKQRQQAQLAVSSSKNTLIQQQTDLIASVISTWYSLVEAKQLLALYQERERNLTNNKDMIQRSYQLGLNKALDVYLAQNDVSREQARVSQQYQSVKVLQRKLEMLIGGYPNAQLSAANVLPLFEDDIVVGQPSELIARRADIKSQWYELLEADAGLAIAHKQRFPSFTIRATTGDNSDELTNLLTGNSLAWSLLGGITAPIFNAGKLASAEEKARLVVKQKEQRYLQNVYQAFADVENAISNRDSLKQRFDNYKQALENALEAEKIAFDQYMKGLVTYTTVLESQRRAFDSQTQLIQLTNQLIQNKVTLHVALGGGTENILNENIEASGAISE